MANRRQPPEPTPTADAAGFLSPLEECLLHANTSYHQLLSQPGQLDQVKELGRTLRCLARCVAQLDLVSDEDLEEEELED